MQECDLKITLDTAVIVTKMLKDLIFLLCNIEGAEQTNHMVAVADNYLSNINLYHH